jgi:hypothetical protein
MRGVASVVEVLSASSKDTAHELSLAAYRDDPETSRSKELISSDPPELLRTILR